MDAMSLTPTQLEARRSGIGASEVAAALGLSPFMTPLRLYQAKRGEAEPIEETLPMRYGNHVEPFILGEFKRKHPDWNLMAAPDTMRRGVMLAHLDAWLPNEANVQVKTARTRSGWGDSGSSEIPQHYLLQVQAEMLVAGLRVSFVPTLFGGADYDEFVVDADRELQDMIEAGVHDFWRRVEQGDPPEPQSVDEAIERWGRASITDRVVADEEALRAVQALRDLKVQQEHMDLAVDQWQAVVMRKLGERDTLVDQQGRTLVTWKAAAAPQRFDTAAFKAAHPELAAEFTKAGNASRRFLIKT
jgi:putative phage-type endonuclease